MQNRNNKQENKIKEINYQNKLDKRDNNEYNDYCTRHLTRRTNGIIAQLGEHLPYKQRVIGSSPIGPILAE